MTIYDPTATPVLPTPVSIDYTNRDFYSLREALIQQVKDRVNVGAASKWYGNDTADFGVAIIEAFAYMGDMLGYYIDRIANESNILTATQRASVLNLARSYGYNPSGYQAATSTIEFANPTAQTGLSTLPAGTQVLGQVRDGDVTRTITFTTTADAVLSPVPSGGSVFVSATHGYNTAAVYPATAPDISGELVGTSDGSANQVYRLAENQVVDGTVKVFVEIGSAYGQWEPVLHLTDYGPTDAVYRLDTDANNNVYVVFGDGISGAIPNTYAKIKAQYIVGGGVVGNVPVDSLTSFGYIPVLTGSQKTAVTQYIKIHNTLGKGGQEPESIETIRINAPKAYATINRAIVTADYAGLAYQVSAVGKANATADVWSSVTLYAAPRRDDATSSVNDLYPGKNDTNTAVTSTWTSLQSDVVAYLTPKLQIGASVTVAPPTYTNLYLDLSYQLDPAYDATQVESRIRDYLAQYYSYNQMSFGQSLYPQNIELILQYVPGVRSIKVKKLYREGATPIATPLIGQTGEIFVLQSSNTTYVTISAASASSSLSALVLANGATTLTLSPSFATGTYSYTTTATGASTISVTPTSSNNAMIAVDGVETSSAATRAVALAVTTSLTGATGTGSVVTYTTATAHKLVVGDYVTVTGFSTTGYNVTNTAITAITGTSFSVAGTTTGSSGASGSAALKKHTINTNVVSEDGTTTKTYAVTVSI